MESIFRDGDRVGAEVEATLWRAHREAELAIERAARRARDRSRAGFERARLQAAEHARLSRRTERELTARLDQIETAYSELAEALAALAARLTEIGKNDWPSATERLHDRPQNPPGAWAA